MTQGSPSEAAATASATTTDPPVSTRGGKLRGAIRVLRVHRWSKNALVLVPVILAPQYPSLSTLVAAALAAFTVSLCASAGYVINDLLDVAADREHATKRNRPFASGVLPLAYGRPMVVLLLALSFGIAAATLPRPFLVMLALYLGLTLTYSLYFKKQLLVDVIALAWLYAHRVVAGGYATGVPISAWLLAFCMFFFFSLAFAKRYVELRQAVGKRDKLLSRGYFAADLEMVAPMGTAAGFMAVLVFCLYIESAGAAAYSHPRVLWFVCPVLLYWVARIWFLAHRGELHDNPVKFAITNRRSWTCAAVIAAVAATARFWP